MGPAPWGALSAGILGFGATLAILPEALYVRRIAGGVARAAGGPRREGPVAPPRVSIVVAARNEARHFAEAARSLLAQDYPDFEVILVDDRSTDGTGRLADELAAGDRRVRALHIRDLPEGWLGKNHALATGAAAASGAWLLFTDGDVWLHPAALRLGMDFAAARGLDHLTIGPAMSARGFWLQCWVAFTLMMMLLFVSPRRMNRPAGPGGFAVGAFNLVRASAYCAVGTHRAVALRPDEDVRLGMRLRRAGFRQWAAAEPSLARVEWYASLGDAVRGLEKNAFAVLGYRPAALAASVAGTLALFVGAPAGAVLLRGDAGWLFRAAVLLQAGAVWLYARTFVEPGRAWRAALVACGYPAAAVLYGYAMAHSGAAALRRGGIVWRDTFYPLPALRGHTGLEPPSGGPPGGTA